MKQKIKSALETKYKNLGFGDKAFDGVAEYLSKTVTEEAKIEESINGVESLLKAFQGDIDKVRNEKSSLQKELDELKKQPEKEKEKEKPKDDLEAKLDALLEAKMKPLQDKLADYEAKEAQAARTALITSKAKELGIPEWRISEGFNIGADADEAAINTVLSGVKQNLVTAGLEKGSAGYPLSDEKEGFQNLMKEIGNSQTEKK